MRLYAFLIFALYVFHSRAASIPALDVADIQKKLAAVAQEVTKKDAVAENVSSEQELIDQANTVKDVENNLRNHVAIADIPVKVVVEEVQPNVKTLVDDKKDQDDKEKTDDNTVIKRAEIDLKNPGPPQRQEHETQNPEYYESVPVKVKQSFADTQIALRQGFQGITQGIQNFITSNEQLANVQQTLQNLQNSFNAQLSKLNETVQSILTGNLNGAQGTPASPEKDDIEKVPLGLRTTNAVKTLPDGTQASVRATAEKQESGSTGGSTAGSQPTNPLAQVIQSLQNTITQGFGNITTALQNTFNQPGSGGNNIFSGIQNILGGNQKPPAGTESDEVSTPQRPGLGLWQGIQSSIQNILTPGQNQASQNGQPSQSSPPGPIAQAIQNNPIVQGVVNLIQPNRPGAQQPAATPQADNPEKPAQSNEGENAVPTKTEPEQSSDDKKPENTDGPIKNIIQNNPIMKGIAGAVQKIQSISNPEKPRDTFEGENIDSEKKDEEKDLEGEKKEESESPKGHGGHGGQGDKELITSSTSGEEIKSKGETATAEELNSGMPDEEKNETDGQMEQESNKTE